MTDLQHLRELAQKAEAIAPGPWTADRDAGGFYDQPQWTRLHDALARLRGAK